MSAHTPGPWRLTHTGTTVYVFGPGRAYIMQQRLDMQKKTVIVEREANARLIAAAPDLLAALQAIAKRIEHDCSEDAVADAEAIALTAIAKATA